MIEIYSFDGVFIPPIYDGIINHDKVCCWNSPRS